MKNKASLRRSILLGLSILVVLFVYAYGFDITKVSLEELRSPQRQESLARVTRALFQPDFLSYDQEELSATVPVYVPCPVNGSLLEQAKGDLSAPYLILSPTCGAPGEVIQVEGFNFLPDGSGLLRFVPGNDPTNQVSLGRDNVQTDGDGYFIGSLSLPNRLSDQVQYVRVIIRRNVGLPHLTQTAHDTWDKIIETVFLALLATTIGTFLAIPLSFIAVRNLMKNVKSPLAKVAFSVLGWPLGIGLGFWVLDKIGKFTTPLATQILVNILSFGISVVAIWYATRWALPQEELVPPKLSVRLARIGVLFLSVVIGFISLYQVAGFTTNIGTWIAAEMGLLSFLGNFMFQLSEILKMLTPTLGGLAAGAVLSSFLGNLGQRGTEQLNASQVKTMNLILSAVAGVTTFGLLGSLVQWLYQVDRIELTLYYPLLTGAVFGLILAAITKPKDSLPIGIVICTISRTFLNTLRSIEALVMAIVFVIAVGIGPFAGVLALGLHTIVSLAKLYSEPVESISAGPLEAVEATGANRLQTIIYAVVPQIIPPYISYTMYRWDINVRMSTIIGFVGGGGIGFLLQQNINLLNYRAASAQMLAIAVMVATMDYVSPALREKVV
jgi:phosphonate ABC transporter permease subunit PhnE